ncbi:glycosyltransferase family 2 protein [Stenotrophomonas sp. PSU-St83]
MTDRVHIRSSLVSVVIPLFNRRDSIMRAINSVLSQDGVELELIVVDDGSTDDSVALVERQISDSRLRIIQQQNAGACSARNAGIDAARGEFVAFLDSDDMFLPGHLSQSLRRLREMVGPAVVYGRIVVDRGRNKTFLKPPRAIRPGEPMSEYLLCDQGFVQTSTVVLSRDLALRTKYDTLLRFGQDTDFAIRLAAAGATFQMLAEPQAIWTDHSAPGRISNALDPFSRLDWLARCSEQLTAKAKKGDQGWYVAKALFKRGHPVRATSLYLRAVVAGCYNAKLAIRIALQIFLPTLLYRKIADKTLSSSR